jgi:AAA domain, putative AbiEii toxin, Type IV TA system
MGESIVDKKLQSQDLQKKYSLHLHRVQVPDFLVLKDIDIVFELDLIPRIFPLGSLNGGGKSTLLQLVFTLLYSCGENINPSFIANMLQGFPPDSLIAKIELVLYGLPIKLEFLTQSIKETTNRVITFSTEAEKRPRKIRMHGIRMEAFFEICEYKTLDSRGILVCNLVEVDYLRNPPAMEELLNVISEHIFLAAPITQSFRFIDKIIRELAFKKRAIGKYHEMIEDVREELTSFFAYDTVAVDILIRSFIKARDDDFRFAIKNGEYGSSYQAMLKDIEEMLGDKKVNIDQDFEGVAFFKKNTDGSFLKLYPEDLSHGELKRLSLFIWLKYNKIENSIVLMDEIEIALHPDWQYQIVRDLETWAPSNQYILATHSYELCHALTPAHVKEISPRLLKK